MLEASEPRPDAETLLSSGNRAAPDREETHTAGGLQPNTLYGVYAVAENAAGHSEVTRTEIATARIRPAVSLAPGYPGETSLSFTLAPFEAEKAAWVCIPSGEAVPSADIILASGFPADAAQARSYSAESLETGALYVIAAAASAGTEISETARIEMATLGAPPEIVLSAGETGSSYIGFTLTALRAERAAWLCLTAEEPVPDASGILARGTPAGVGSPVQCRAENLGHSTEYTIAAAAKNKDGLSAVAVLKVTTAPVVPPAFGDYYYSDGSWSSGDAEPDPAKTCIGIVFYAGRGEHPCIDDCAYTLKDGTTPLEEVSGYVIALDDASADGMSWGSWGRDGQSGAGTSTDRYDFRGYSNTLTIKAKAERKHGALSDEAEDNYPAAYRAHVLYETVVPAPESSSGWFLPSAGQLKYIGAHRAKIEENMHRLGRGDIGAARDWYWSSSEYNNNGSMMYNAWYQDFHHGYDEDGGYQGWYRKMEPDFSARSVLVF